MFPCDEWISEDAAKERVLLAGVGVEDARKEVAKGQRKYVVTTVTSSDSYSGTKADVFIKVKGPKGEFTQTLEDKTMFGARFEEGKEDAFTFDAADVADVDPKDKSWLIEEVTLGVSGGGMMASMMGSDWKLYTVTIQDVATGADLTLVCDDWVKDDAPQVWRRADGDKKTGLRVASASGDEGEFKYRVEIVTGSKRNSGTDSRVSIALKGDKKPAEWWTPTLLQTEGSFETGATDTFMLSRGEDLGTITD